MKRHDEQREKRKRTVLSVIIVLIMSLSVLGYMIDRQDSSSNKYNGFKFIQTSKGWKTNVDGAELYFYYTPNQVENINLSEEIINLLRNGIQFYQTSNVSSASKQTIALVEFELNEIFLRQNKYAVNSFTTENEFSLPIITCLNATQYNIILLYEKSNETNVLNNRYCINVRARNDNDFLALKDRIAYTLLGVMD
jgi:hypothetical protein